MAEARKNAADPRPDAGGEAPQFTDPKREWRRLFAESWGTFLLVTVAAGGAISHDLSPEKVSYGMAVVAPGILIMTAIYALGEVSGAHLNPAVTVAFALRRNFPWAKTPGYIAAQFVGAVLAALFLRLIFGMHGDFGATLPRADLSGLEAIAVETMLTTGLVTTILATASGARNVGPNAAIAVGGYIALTGMWAGPLTGASMNPFRTLGPDLIRGDLHASWIFVAGPLLGAMIAVGFEWLLKGPPSAEGSRSAQGDAEKG